MLDVVGRVLTALKLLKPKINNSGAGSVQVGKAGGSVRIVNVTQHQPVAHHGAVTHVQLTQHIYASPPPMPAPAQAPPPARPVEAQRVAQPLTDVHKEVLTLMQPLPKVTRIKVLDFMRREFGTAMVKELRPQEAYRVKMYVQQVRQTAARRKPHELL